MYTSERDLKKSLLLNVIGTAFLALLGAIYELFSHEVYSYFMIYAFAIPLMLGALPCALLLIYKKNPPGSSLKLWNAGITTLAVGCAFRGALDIYGTTNLLVIAYPTVGAILLAAALITGFVRIKRDGQSSD